MARRKRKLTAAKAKKAKLVEEEQAEEEIDLTDSQTEATTAESQEDSQGDGESSQNESIEVGKEEEGKGDSQEQDPEKVEVEKELGAEDLKSEVSNEATEPKAASPDHVESELNEEKPVVEKEESSVVEEHDQAMDVEEPQEQSEIAEESAAEPKSQDLPQNEDDNKENENKPSNTVDGSEAETVKNDDIKEENAPTEEMEVSESQKEATDPVAPYEAKYIDYDGENVQIDIDPEFDNPEDKVEGDESADYLKYWRTVTDSPHDFTSWTYLLQLVEQEGKVHLGRRAYNSFFKRYPLCYGYWKKFSEFERKHGNLARAQKILERGVRSIPLSIDLWVHTIEFYTNHYKGLDAGKDKVRKVYERALKAVGLEFRSEKLWNKYIQWELVNNDWKGVISVYDRAIRTETQHYSVFFNDFKEFLNTHMPEDWMPEEEYKNALLEVRQANALIEKEKEGEEETDDDKKDAPDVNTDDPVTDQEITAIRLNYIKEKKKVYDETEQSVTKIWAFEEGIKRPYFHVKQLERAQLKNWREYLDMEIGRENHEKVVLLFERCLIACALYEDFWLKYAKYMAKFDDEKSRVIYKRACNTHLPKKPNIHMQWAAFEELHGNISEASRILKKLDNALPGMAMIKMRRVAVERRAGNYQVAEDLLRANVASAAKDKEEVFYTRKLAWFLFKISNKKDEARKLMKDLIQKYKGDVRLYNDLVEMEFQIAGSAMPATEDEERHAIEAFDIALRSEKLTDEQKNSFSQRKVEFLEDFGIDVKRLQKAYDEHQKVLRNQKKRAQTESADGNPAKKAKNDSTSISVVGAGQMTNGATQSTTSATTAAQPTSYSSAQTNAQQAAYNSDPNMYYQNYWNYQQNAGDPSAATAQYNYSQWGQYYAGQQQQQQQ